MTGFIKGLFNKSKSAAEPKPEKPKPVREPKSKPEAAGQAYYLSDDEAKTFGDIEYMRTSKTIRKTFPKAKFGNDYESIRSTASVNMPPAVAKLVNEASTNPASTETGPQAVPQEPARERRKADSSMDMFRNMARDIKKKG